ncbi:LOW QUALITY PROTEIN: serine-rich adhesin for platelets [Drosophila ficusphila]|uniref:LOW QUALITY PROTEIN: serine-rich adhesin for platelets n=1 Tax=Drosophila ficusphila TaxID=30025 RepID=UPI0007E67050|nr:LOW QUALITY PROTEIN: serine-rich adhesin for platelets [Drosophila ficusphila]
MVISSKPDATAPNGAAGGAVGATAAAQAAAPGGLDATGNSLAHPSGIPQDQIDNIMSGIANTGDVKMNNHRKKLRQRFDIIKKLGQGTYGKVQLGINKETGQEVAIKTIKKCKIEAEADLVRIRREVQIMSSVHHPNIIHIYEVFENREKMVLVMEFAAGGELYDYLSERKVLAEEEARRIFRQVATAVYYCHKHKICHRDLKLENILLDEKGNAKIADFGLSNVFDDQRLLGTFCGSPLYASPEIVEGTPYQGPEVDCWSLGVLLYTLVYGSMPFDGSNFKRLVKQISQGDYYEPRKPSRASTLIRDMLTVCPRKRASIEQICSHWWVNENDNVSCLDLAEDLANQTPVRLDVLLSLTPATITADQLVVPSAEGAAAAKAAANERVPRSHSVGSIRDMGPPNTEAERRILDMVAAGGEAALMPSPTRTITPAQSPVQTKRKLQPTVSTENAAGTTAKKKEKPANSSFVISKDGAPLTEAPPTIVEPPTTLMEAETIANMPEEVPVPSYSQKDMQMVGDLCEQLMGDAPNSTAPPAAAAPPAPTPVARQATRGKLDAVVETPEEKDATKVIKKFVNKHKTADLVNAINESATKAAAPVGPPAPPPFVRKCSLQDESTLNKFNAERRKSRILETAEKFQPPPPVAASAAPEKPKKLSIPGVSVGSFKKEFEKKATNPPVAEGPTPGELRAQEQVAAAAAAAQETEALGTPPASPVVAQSLEGSDSKNSVASISLDEARRSMENSIALLLQAQNESSKEVDQLCAQTETIGVSEPGSQQERERKLKNARAIIGNAIQPVIRRPTPFYGIGNGFGSGMVGGGSGAGAGGVGGAAPKRAQSGGNFMGYNTGAMSPGAATSPPIAGPQTAPPVLISPNALAAAKQTIQQRIFGGGLLPGQSNQAVNRRPATWQPQASYSTASIFQPPPNASSPFKMLQQQYQQRCQEDQRPSSLFTPPPSPQYAASHALALAAQSNSSGSNSGNSNNYGFNSSSNSSSSGTSNNRGNCNTMPNLNYNVNSRTRPFNHNQAQDTLNTNASATCPLPAAMWLKSSPGGEGPPTPPGAVKTSTASITLKSATLPRRKINAKAEVQLDIKPRIPEQGAPPQPAMRFSTEMQHPVADLRSAPPREGPIPYSPIKTTLQARATSLEPKEHVITIQRPPTQHAYGRTSSNTTTRSGSLSRQSTVESESDATTTATNMSQATITSTSQPIKKSPREFIIPIAVEGGGFITPRERSVEPSESSHTTSSRSTFTRLRPSRRIGSLLSEAGFEEGSPFPKMRTTSITREGVSGGAEDEARFTPHRLRSSRPVKKISQDNDSQSSNEEDDDDDDGFEILTAENLFSTLLQRVRALTNRLNVNSDLTVGFPSHSSRLLTDISRQAQSHSPFWSQGSPFASVLRSQVSYTYSETVEKKKVRLNSSNTSGLGAPWRHSMSRDLGSDMESMFSRTGATLPRGHHQGKNKPSSAPAQVEKGCAKETAASNTEEPLDLADLDLSRLRLSKKDLETLSSITPGLPKCFQEQLLAKLPPTQARKLSRTLSVQTSAPSSSSTPKVYKRSQSGGRGYQPEQQEELPDFKPKTLTDAPKTTSASTAIYRRSLSRSQATPTQNAGQDAESRATQTTKSRSSSVCRDDYGKSSLCSSSTYTSDISEKYKYYSPYLSKSSNVSPSMTSKDALEKRYSGGLGRPPSGCLSPPPQLPQVAATEGTSSLRVGRSSQRRISRFLRPDFFDEPRDRETQSMLREIREKSIDRQDQEQSQDLRRRKHSLPNVEHVDQPIEATPIRSSMRHSRNKSMELFTDAESNGQVQEPIKTSSARQRSVSRARELETELDKHELADKILQELQLLSAVRTQHEQGQESEKTEETSTIKKVRKLKPKESTGIIEPEASKISSTSTSTTTTLVRKVKKISKKTDETSKITGLESTELSSSVPKETKLKRPKSYPMKDLGLSLKSSTDLPEPTASLLPSKLPSKLPSGMNNESGGEPAPRESRLMRPKSYPATKLATPKELRKVTRSGVAIPTITEATPAPTAMPTPTSSKSTSEEKSLSATPTGTMTTVTDAKDTGSSSSDSRPTTIKKIIKVSKKSKLMPPTPLTPTTSTTTATTTANTTPVDSSKESSPVIKAKEKSPEKKPSKGLLYALGQKFEKLRDSAMSKEKKAGAAGAAASLACTQKQGSPEERSSPEKYKKKVLETDKSLELGAPEDKRVDKRSRFDSVLRSLRERSVPRSQPNGRVSPKRAASVEELHAGSQEGQGKSGGAVNKMFGGFLRRFDRESSEQRRVRSTRSTSNIERQVREEQDQKLDASLPTSPIYQNVVKATKVQANPKPGGEENCNCETACPDCRQNKGQTLTTSNAPASTTTTSNKEKRKGLMLDLASANATGSGASSAVTTATTTTSSGSRYRGSKTNPALLNGNGGLGMGLYSNLPPYPGAIKSESSSQQSMENATNNNSTNTNNNCSSQTSGYRTSSAHEINRNNPLLTPSFENIANYSSDSRSYQDDCASTSTFLSPTEEPELYFDNWSICSEDNYMLHATPSPTVSRLSRASLSSPTRCSESSDPNESVIDRIKRRSFYSRFNEQKKPRRTSSIVGPSAVRDYYREQQAAVKARSSHKLHAAELDPPPRAHSPDIAQQFFRPLKLSPVGTELKPPVYRSTLDYSSSSAGATSKPRKSLNDIRNTSPSFLSKRYETTDYSSVPMRYKSSSSSSPSNGAIASGYYNTYNPKRRSSYTLNGSLPTATSGSSAAGSSHLDGYATLGRRSIRPYDHRTMSLLEPPTSSSSRIGEGTSYQRREARTPVRDYTSSISRSGSRYRTSSATRSPTNI